MSSIPSPASPKLHTPAELLTVAEKLVASPDDELMRAAVLESLSAFEWYVHETVFPLLGKRYSPEFTKWLEEKTKMSFDDRLLQLVPLATGIKVAQTDSKWQQYKKSKKVRNAVAHTGRKIDRLEAVEVLKMVKSWLAFLGATAELNLSLLGLKKYLESKSVFFSNGDEATRLVQKYYEKTSPARAVEREKALGRFRADLVLSFDSYNVLIEVKVSKTLRPQVAVQQVREMARVANSIPDRNEYRSVIVYFTEAKIPPGYEAIQVFEDDTLLVVIQVHGVER